MVESSAARSITSTRPANTTSTCWWDRGSLFLWAGAAEAKYASRCTSTPWGRGRPRTAEVCLGAGAGPEQERQRTAGNWRNGRELQATAGGVAGEPEGAEVGGLRSHSSWEK